MKLNITKQDSYSRGELLLRTFLGFFYILLPHAVLMLFLGIWSAILSFISFWIVLFTGKYPQSFFEYQIKLRNYGLRLMATMMNLVDGYPAFGINGTSENVSMHVPYPEKLSRGKVLLRMFFGIFYIALPHGFCLMFRLMVTNLFQFLAWWVVLFTGKFPESWHEFNVGTIRWMSRLNLYNNLLTDDYPPFTGKEIS